MPDHVDQGSWVFNQVSTTAGSLIEACLALERQGKLAEALQMAAQALELAELQKDRHAAGMALVAESQVRFRLGQYADANALAEQVISRAPPKSLPLAKALLLHGMCAAETNSLDKAEQYYHQAADLAREMGFTEVHCRALHDLASGVYLPRGRFDLALKTDEEAYRMAQVKGLNDWIYFPLTTIAWGCHLTGQRQRMREVLEELGQVLSKDWAAYGFYEYFLAELALDEGYLERGLDLLVHAFASAESSGDPALMIFSRLGMSRYHLLSGNVPAARSWANDAQVCASRYGYRHLVGQALIERGRTAWLSGEVQAAESDLASAVDMLGQLGAAFDLARALLVRAGLRFKSTAYDPSNMIPKTEHVENDTLLAVQAILSGGYEHLLDQERALALPLIAAHTVSANRRLAGACRHLLERFSRMPSEPLRVITLGKFEIWQGRRLVEKRSLNQRRAGELFAFLLLSPGRALQFDAVVEAMYPDKNLAAARIAFHHTTSALRQALEPDLPDKFPSRYLKVEEGLVTLRLPLGSRIDFEEFQAACHESRWDAALSIYGGDLLDEFRYTSWLMEPRQKLNLLVQGALLALAEGKLKSGQFTAAIDYSQRLLEMDPWQEPAVLIGIRACLGMNNKAGALRLYRKFAKTLQDELDVEPGGELQDLVRAFARK